MKRAALLFSLMLLGVGHAGPVILRAYSSGAAADVLPPLLDYRLGTTVNPTCSAAEGCVALCTPNAGGTAWSCVDATGAAVCTQTPGAGTTFYNGFGGSTQKVMGPIDDAKAYTATCVPIDNIFDGDFTVVIGGYPVLGSSSGVQMLYSHNDSLAGVWAREESGAVSCVFFETPGFPARTTPTSSLNGWNLISCRRTGNDHIANLNGVDSATTTQVNPHVDAVAGVSRFGRNSSANQYSNGPLAFVAIYNVAKSAAWHLEAAQRFGGVWPLVGMGGGVRLVDQGSGQSASPFNPGFGLTTQRFTAPGAYIQQGLTNNWAVDTMAAASWTDVGTPTVTSNASSGPFAQWKNAAECDLIVDDDPAAFEGKQSTGSAGNTAHAYTSSCYVAAGTSGVTTDRVRLTLETDGTGATSCDFTGLTSTVERKTCTSQITGSPTFVRGRVLVGNSAATLGSVTVCQCQLTPHTWPQEPVPDNTTRGNVLSYIPSPTWPFGSAGAREVVFTPTWTWPAGISTGDTAESIYLFDEAVFGVDHRVIMQFRADTSQAFGRVVGSDAGFTDMTVAPSPLIAGQMYVMRITWATGGTPCVNRLYLNTCSSVASCHATTEIANTTSGQCATTSDRAYLVNRYSGDFPGDMVIHAVRAW